MKNVYAFLFIMFTIGTFSFAQENVTNSKQQTISQEKPEVMKYKFNLYGVTKEKVEKLDKEFTTRSGVLYTKSSITKENRGEAIIYTEKNITPDDIQTVLHKLRIKTDSDISLEYISKEQFRKDYARLLKLN